MTLFIEVKLQGVEKLSKSEINAAMREANKQTGIGFRRRLLPERFTPQGGRRLGYTPRKGEIRIGRVAGNARRGNSYAARKLRHLGHLDPLVLSGQGKRLALAQRNLVRSTKDKISIPLPRKFNLRTSGSRVNMADEIRSVTGKEMVILSAELVANYERALARAAGETPKGGFVRRGGLSGTRNFN